MGRAAGWIIAGASLGAAAAVAAGYILVAKRGAHRPADQLLTLRCEFAYQLPVHVNIWPGRGVISFDGGPILHIDEMSTEADGGLAIRASSEAYELFGTVNSTASIRFRSKPGNYDEIVCPIVIGALPALGR